MASAEVAFNHKLVHLDLKGAPPKIEYLEKIFPLMKKWGATGLLVEYEDCFPYSADLQVLHTQQPYKMDEIVKLQQLAAENHLMVIPLVQTFGHLEFVLKHAEFQGLREVHKYPMALCPSNPDSLQLVCSMVDQIIAAHSNLKWIHIGCDEVYHLGVCEKCLKRQTEDGVTPDQLFFSHVKNVAQHIRDYYPNITPIVWDDMFRNLNTQLLKDSGLGGLVEPMVWHYPSTFQLPDGLWEKLSEVFPKVWVASAFKGATGSRACVTSIAYHLENHVTWLSTLQPQQNRFCVQGIAVTGWQRFDHFAVMCELLPQALPCLGICLQTLEKGSFTADVHKSVSDDLGFTSHLPLNPFVCVEIPHCSFPGSGLYQFMLEYAFLEASTDRFLNNDGCLTWMNEYNVRRNFTNPVHLEPISTVASEKLRQLLEFKDLLAEALSEMFFPATVEEWLGTHLQPLIDRVHHCQQAAQQQLAITLQ